MKILLFISSGMDTPGPSYHLYNALIQDLIDCGHTVHLIESHSTGIQSDIPPSVVGNKNFTYDVVRRPVEQKTKFVRRYLTGVKYCFDAIRVLRKQHDIDVVMVQSCPWAPFAVSFAKWCVKAPVIYNSQDMFPGASIANGVMKRKWMQKFFYAFQKIAYRRADHITVISEDMRAKFIEQGSPDQKITVINNWYDDRNVREIPWEENIYVKKNEMSKDIFYVQYAGTIGFNFDYRLVVKVAELLKDQKDIVFQMIGEGSQKEAFVRAAKKRGLTNIVFLPIEKQEMVAHVYSSCSVCLIPLPSGVIGNSVPSKAGLLMACHRVIVTSADEESDYNNMFNREQIGIACSCKEPESVAEAILKLKSDVAYREACADRARLYGKKYYSRTRNTALYEQLFRKIASFH